MRAPLPCERGRACCTHAVRGPCLEQAASDVTTSGRLVRVLSPSGLPRCIRGNPSIFVVKRVKQIKQAICPPFECLLPSRS